MTIWMGDYENRHKEPREIFISHHKIKIDMQTVWLLNAET